MSGTGTTDRFSSRLGLLLSVPNVASSVIEPFLGILGDVWRRRLLVLGGGIAYGAAALLVALSGNFTLFLLAMVLMYPASGAFVSLSQATLMDHEPERHDQNMARWTLAGSVGVVAGPLALGAAVWAGIGWRGMFGLLAVLTLFVVWIARGFRFPTPRATQAIDRPSEAIIDPDSDRVRAPDQDSIADLLKLGWRGAIQALKRKEVLRWLTLLEFSDLILDVLLGFLALYMVDVVGVSPAQAGLAVAVWSAVGLAGDLLLIPLLERVDGLSYLRVSVVIELLLYPVFLLTPGYGPKLIVLGLLGFFNAGWYSILSGRLYSAMPGQSGTVMTLGNIFGFWGGLLPLGLGATAQRFGLPVSMWLLLAGPLALLVGLPRKR